jgi:hypothetical protein
MKASEGIQKLDADSFERMLRDVLDFETGERKLDCISRQHIPEKIRGSVLSQRYFGEFLHLFGRS